MIKQVKEIKEISINDLEYIFGKTFPLIPDFCNENRIINFTDNYIHISNLGCNLKIWHDFNVEIYCQDEKIKYNLLNLLNSLIEVGILEKL